MVLLHSVRIPRVPTYSGYPLHKLNFTYGTFTLSRPPFQVRSIIDFMRHVGPLPRTYCYMRFGLLRFRSPLLSESLFYFLFLRVIRCFSSPGSLRIPIDSVYDTMTLLIVSSLIRISADRGSFAAPRSFSQLVTSFFGAMYQGIHLYALCSLIFLDCIFAIRRIFLPQRILILRFSANFLSVKLAGYFLRFQFVIVLTFALFVQLASNFFCFSLPFVRSRFFLYKKTIYAVVNLLVPANEREIECYPIGQPKQYTTIKKNSQVFFLKSFKKI